MLYTMTAVVWWKCNNKPTNARWGKPSNLFFVVPMKHDSKLGCGLSLLWLIVFDRRKDLRSLDTNALCSWHFVSGMPVNISSSFDYALTTLYKNWKKTPAKRMPNNNQQKSTYMRIWNWSALRRETTFVQLVGFNAAVYLNSWSIKRDRLDRIS